MRNSVLASLFLSLAAPAMATPLLVDGNLNDWHVTVSDSSTHTPASIFTSVSVDQGTLFSSAIEDTDDLAGDSGYLGPHYGGQNYDAEFMAVAIANSKIYLAIVSGQRPDNGLQRYSPGDLRIVANNGITYGLEIGGGTGGAANQGAITEGAAGSTYVLNGSGWTQSVNATSAAQTAGSLWRNVTWINSPIDGAPVQFVANAQSSLVGMADYYFSRNAFGSQHSIIELSLDVNLFGNASNLDFYWGPSCNNDVLTVKDDLTNSRVPLPGTLTLLGLGLFGVSVARRKFNA